VITPYLNRTQLCKKALAKPPELYDIKVRVVDSTKGLGCRHGGTWLFLQTLVAEAIHSLPVRAESMCPWRNTSNGRLLAIQGSRSLI